MLDPKPRVPTNLNPFARELLEMLRGQPAARHIILGGGVALSHYLEYRETVNVHAWWPKPLEPGALEETTDLVRRSMRMLAERHGLEFDERIWGETRSLECRRGSRKVFSFQISFRDIQLDAPQPADWPPMLIETFRENLAAKMRALMHRGAPRDFSDIAALCGAGYVTVADCWALWLQKTPGGRIDEARAAALGKIEEIAARRPLDRIGDRDQRAKAGAVRRFVREEFCARGSDES